MSTEGHINKLEYRIIHGIEGISSISEDWDDLFNRSEEAQPYLSRTWIQTFVTESHIKGKPLFITVWSDSKLVAVLPLDVQNIYGICIGRLISDELPSYLGLLLDRDYPDAAGVVAEAWIKENIAHVFHDKHLSSHDKATQSLVKELHIRGFKYKYDYKRLCHEIKLGCSFDEYMQKNKTGKRRRKLAYSERQLYKSGDVKIARYIGKDITPDILSRIAQIQEESWMKRRGAAVLGQPFYKKMLLNLAEAGFASLWLMTIDGEDAAFAFSSIVNDIEHYQYTAFKLKYELSLSIGQILLMNIIRDSCNDNIRYLDFGHGDAEYKRFWANQSHDVQWVIAGRGIIGNIVIIGYMLAWKLARQKNLLSLYKRIRKQNNSR